MGNSGISRREEVGEALAGWRLDRAAAEMFPEFSRSRLQVWIKSGDLTVNAKALKQREKLNVGDIIEIDAEIELDGGLAADEIDLDIRHEDEHLLVVNKPENLVVHPAAGHPRGTLLNGLLHRYPELAGLPRAGIIHRLDKDTTGLLLIARTLPAHTGLVRQLQERRIERIYQAVVAGVIVAGGTVDQAIGRHPVQRKRMAVVESGKPARTHYRVLERFRRHTLIEAALESGRTHQIRVHLSWLGHPVTGDRDYGGRPKLPPGCGSALAAALGDFPRQALHAHRLALAHPVTGDRLALEVDPPPDMADLLAVLRRDASDTMPAAGKGTDDGC